MVVIKKYVPIAKEKVKKPKKVEKVKKSAKKVRTYPVKKDIVIVDAKHVAKLKIEHARRKAELEKQKVLKKKNVGFKQSISRPISFLINRNLVTKYCETCNKNYEVSPDRIRCYNCETTLIKPLVSKPKKPVKTSSGKPKKPKRR